MRWFGWTMTGMLAMTGLACDDKNDVPPEMLQRGQSSGTDDP